jgi:peptidoglycan/xylan/chitin deacetylase (PgdA/CDA1 family)
MRTMPAAAQKTEIAESNRILRSFDAKPVLFRPPYGRYTLELLANARAEGMIPVLWSVDTRDWQVRDPDKIVQHVRTVAGTGSVLLMHSTYPSTLSALPRVIKELRAKGCQFVTLSEWIERMRRLAAPHMVNASEPVISASAPIGPAQN